MLKMRKEIRQEKRGKVLRIKEKEDKRNIINGNATVKEKKGSEQRGERYWK